jgi:hypothetical protein
VSDSPTPDPNTKCYAKSVANMGQFYFTIAFVLLVTNTMSIYWTLWCFIEAGLAIYAGIAFSRRALSLVIISSAN